MCSSILTGVEDGEVIRLVESTNSKVVFRESAMAKSQTREVNARIAALETGDYKRLQSAVKDYGNILCLSIGDLNDPIMLENFWQLKRWCYRHGSSNVDQVCTYLKYLTKMPQAIFLCCELPEVESYFPSFGKYRHPYVYGELEFISLYDHRRVEPMELKQYEVLAQLAAGTRAGPYPSLDDIIISVDKTINLVVKRKVIEPSALDAHRRALESFQYLVGTVADTSTHISLSKSGAYEISRENGGRGGYLVSLAKELCSCDVRSSLDLILGLKDAFGKTVLDPLVYESARNRDGPLTFGEVAYLSIQEWAVNNALELAGPDKVPQHLAEIILLVSSRELMQYGEYYRTECLFQGCPLFVEPTEYQPTVDSLPLTMSVSLEAPRKTRMPSGAVSAYTEVGQVFNNILRTHLSKDQTLRIGFDEADKLWETLKEYRKKYPSGELSSFFLSADLTEATYNISHEILDANMDSIDFMLRDIPAWGVFRKLFRVHRRTMDMSQLERDGYWFGESEVQSESGSFMGDVLSFIHLSLVMKSLSYQAMPEQSRKDIFQPRKTPIMQSVGDDLVMLGIDERTGKRFVSSAIAMGLELSKINALNRYTMTFCEQYACSPSDFDEVSSSKHRESVFGNLIFLDVIKGSILTGKSKIKVDGSSPFLGHAKMLNKQIAYIADEVKARRARVLLWVANYRDCIGIGVARCHLPEMLGGLNVAVGGCEKFDSQMMQTHYVPYLIGMLRLPRSEFLTHQLMLSSIFKANPKGFRWEAEEEQLALILSNARIVDQDDLGVPEHILRGPTSGLLSFIKKEGFISMAQLAEEISRRDTYLKLWRGEEQPAYMTLTTKGVGERHRRVWEGIRRSVRPVREPMITSFGRLEKLFQLNTWGAYIHRDDPSIAMAMAGMPSLFLNL